MPLVLPGFLTALPQRQSQLRRGPFQGGDDEGQRKARFKAFFANWLSLVQISACEQWGHCFVKRMALLALGCKNDDRG